MDATVPDDRKGIEKLTAGIITHHSARAGRWSRTSHRSIVAHEKGPFRHWPEGPIKSAMTYFPAWQYHRRQGLHCCVRNGNRCFPLPMVTDKSIGRRQPTDGSCHDCSSRAARVERMSILESTLRVLLDAPVVTVRPRIPNRNPVDAIKSSTVSTASLSTFLCLHVQPINPVVFRGSHVTRTCNTHLQVGFPLRCFQRLSLPYLATQRWTERSNWHTRGTSFKVLSY